MQISYHYIRGVELVNSIRQVMPHFVLGTDIWTGTHKIIEVFPTGSCIELFPEIAPVKYKVNKKRPIELSKAEVFRLLTYIRQNIETYADVTNFDEFFDSALDIQSLSERQYKHFEDKLDAFLCALTTLQSASPESISWTSTLAAVRYINGTVLMASILIIP